MKDIISNSLQLCQILQDSFNNRYNGAVHGYSSKCEFRINEGRRYLRVVQVCDYQQRAHCFIDRNTGDVYKAASWTQPAKGVRFNILKDLEVLRQRADYAGGYLYK